MMSIPTPIPSRSSEAFAWLRAEREENWLVEVFYPPPEFEAMADNRSIVVFGASGAGKSALRLALARRGMNPLAPHLIVHWQPFLPLAGDRPGEQGHACMEQIFTTCAQALIVQAARDGERFASAPGWVLTILHEFVLRYFRGNLTVSLSRLEDQHGQERLRWLQEWLKQPAQPMPAQASDDEQVIAELAAALVRIGLNGVWVMVDGMEPWVNLEPETTGDIFRSLLSILPIFEDASFALKLVAPADLRPQLMLASGITRRRIDPYELNWQTPALTAMVERRLAWASDRTDFALSDLCRAEAFREWLQHYGGQSPRDWLELIRPFFAAYHAVGGEKPLDEATWLQLKQKHPPKLRLDLANQKVFLGADEITGVQPTSYQILRYLYLHPQRRSSRRELFYRAHQGLNHEPRTSGDKDWEDGTTISVTVDNIILRLRKAIEPQPKSPIYLITDRGKWVRLENAW